jgi:hypothetical protein
MTDGAPFNIAASSPEQCAAHLATLEADPDWSGRLAKGTAATYAELKALSHKINGVSAPDAPADGLVRDANGNLDLMNARRNLRGEVTSSYHGTPTLSDSEKLEMWSTLRNQGFDDFHIEKRLYNDDRVFTAQTVKEVKAEWERLEADPEFRRRLLAGDSMARKALSEYAIIITARVEAA